MGEGGGLNEILHEHLRAGPSTQKTLQALSAGIRGRDTVWEMEGGLGGTWTLGGPYSQAWAIPLSPAPPRLVGVAESPPCG